MPTQPVLLELGAPPPELLEYSARQRGEDPATRLRAIDELRDLIYERGECTPHRMDDEFLVRFLRARKFIPQRAHRLMVNYYQFKEDYPDLFDFYPMDLRRIGDADVIAAPPYRDQDGRRMLLYRIGRWDPKAISIDDLFRGTLLAMELGIIEQQTQILGAVAVFDLEGIGTQHAWQITPAVAAKMVKILVSSSLTITHAIHVINHAWIFDKIYNIFKPLLNAEMRSRIYFHGHDIASLHKHIHPDHLPQRYGGIWPDYSYTIWLESLKNNLAVVKELMGHGYKFRKNELGVEVLEKLTAEGVVLD